jgi:hypothetical protein
VVHVEFLVQLKRVWADGTSHLLFEPLEFLEKLAALTPRPRINLILYHGMLGPARSVGPRREDVAKFYLIARMEVWP